jgi:hypothetical protein
VGGRGAATPATRLLEALLLLLLVLGAFALWVGVPAMVLWALGKATNDPTEHLILGLIAVPVGMVLFGLVLVVINTAFLRVSGDSLATADDASGWKPSLRGPLDRIVGVSAVICLAAFLAWLLFGSAGVGPAGPW